MNQLFRSHIVYVCVKKYYVHMFCILKNRTVTRDTEMLHLTKELNYKNLNVMEL